MLTWQMTNHGGRKFWDLSWMLTKWYQIKEHLWNKNKTFYYEVSKIVLVRIQVTNKGMDDRRRMFF